MGSIHVVHGYFMIFWADILLLWLTFIILLIWSLECFHVRNSNKWGIDLTVQICLLFSPKKFLTFLSTYISVLRHQWELFWNWLILYDSWMAIWESIFHWQFNLLLPQFLDSADLASSQGWSSRQFLLKPSQAKLARTLIWWSWGKKLKSDI